MKHKSIVVLMLSIVALLVSACGGAGSADPAGATQAWFEAFTRFDIERMGELTCDEEKAALSQGLDAFSGGGEIGLAELAELFEFDFSGLKFVASNVTEASAIVNISGAMKITFLGESDEESVSSEVPLVNEGGAWKVCTSELPGEESSGGNAGVASEEPAPIETDPDLLDDFIFEVVGQDEDKIGLGGEVFVQRFSSSSEYLIRLTEAGCGFDCGILFLWVPFDVQPGTLEMNSYTGPDSKTAPFAELFTSYSYLSVEGSLTIDSISDDMVSGSFEFTGGREDDLSLTVSVDGSFTDIELPTD